MTRTRRVLVLAPHTDDGEFGAGGTIARWLSEGDEVTVKVLEVDRQGKIRLSIKEALEEAAH